MYHRNWGDVITVVIRLQTGLFGVRVPEGARAFSQNIQTDSKVHTPTLLIYGHGSSSPGRGGGG
jgi:hypothetical protein